MIDMSYLQWFIGIFIAVSIASLVIGAICTRVAQYVYFSDAPYYAEWFGAASGVLYKVSAIAAVVATAAIGFLIAAKL